MAAKILSLLEIERSIRRHERETMERNREFGCELFQHRLDIGAWRLLQRVMQAIVREFMRERGDDFVRSRDQVGFVR